MVRAGLGSSWQCIFSNDFDHKKSNTYVRNWGADNFLSADIRTVVPEDLQNVADLAWASFPCQDLSLAGGGAGLRGERSGTFWPFWNLMSKLKGEGRAPKTIILENVCGALTSHQGEDFKAICEALSNIGYRFGACVIDAKFFLPQSRPRLFIIAVDESLHIKSELISSKPESLWHTKTLVKAYERLGDDCKSNWFWWKLDPPNPIDTNFVDLIEDCPESVEWHSAEETSKLLSMMSELNLEKVKNAQSEGTKVVGTIYKRTRVNSDGNKVQRAEVRFDNIAGCLRTPSGGSSRQVIMVVEGSSIRTRLISSRETARLMGLPDSYELPKNYNEAYHLTGDGVAVPVVKYLEEFFLRKLLNDNNKAWKAA